MVPLFGPVPGGVEMLVILLVALVVFGLPLLLVGGGLYAYLTNKSDGDASEELENLRREVERLRDEVEQLDDDQK